MYRECELCVNNRIDFNEYDPTDDTWWYERQLSDIEAKNGKHEKRQVTVKVRVGGDIGDLAEAFEDDLTSRFC